MGGRWRDHLVEDSPGLLRIKAHDNMLVDAMMVTTPDHLNQHADDRGPEQLVNTTDTRLE